MDTRLQVLKTTYKSHIRGQYEESAVSYRNKGVDMYKEKARKKKDVNPFTIKKGYYITELNMGDIPGDGYELISTSDIAGPFKTLDRAREIFKKIVCGDKFRNHWDFGIVGPEHRPNGYPTPWYSFCLLYTSPSPRD